MTEHYEEISVREEFQCHSPGAEVVGADSIPNRRSRTDGFGSFGSVLAVSRARFGHAAGIASAARHLIPLRELLTVFSLEQNLLW